LLQRRHVAIDRIRFIGKESNELEEIGAGLIHSAADAYTEFVDPSRDDWERKIRPALKKMSLPKLCKETGFSRRALINWRTGKSRPHPRNQRLLIDSLRRIG
jgi:lambda repressor-like predicted transcriptional regulator